MEVTAKDIARSLWIIYQHMPVAVQDEFKRLIDDEDDTEVSTMVYVNSK